MKTNIHIEGVKKGQIDKEQRDKVRKAKDKKCLLSEFDQVLS